MIHHHPFLKLHLKSSQEIDLRYHGGKTVEISIVNPRLEASRRVCFGDIASKTRFALGCFAPAVKSSWDHEPSWVRRESLCGMQRDTTRRTPVASRRGFTMDIPAVESTVIDGIPKSRSKVSDRRSTLIAIQRGGCDAGSVDADS